jgi:hypothetical protein
MYAISFACNQTAFVQKKLLVHRDEIKTIIFTFYITIPCLALTIQKPNISKGYVDNNKLLQGSFSGKITDAKTNKPIPGVSIYFADLKLGTSTDASGDFKFRNIPEGKHLVEISHIGYSTITDNIDISGIPKRIIYCPCR